MTIADLFIIIQKRIRLIIVVSVIFSVIGLLVALNMQTYTAKVNIEYTYDGARDGLDPLGGVMDVYEITYPAVIMSALSDMETDLSVEDVRNALVITPVITSNDTKLQAALTDKGEEYIINPVEYSITYTYKRSYGKNFGTHMIYNILKSYDDFFATKYLGKINISNIMNIVDIDSMEYIDICEILKTQLENIDIILNDLEKAAPNYSSAKTGLGFASLKNRFYMIEKNERQTLYACIRNGIIYKNKDVLLESYKKRIEDLNIIMLNSKDESDLAFKMVEKFYEQYKLTNLYYQAQTIQGDTQNSNENNSIVYDYDLELMMNTYDDILLRYVSSGVSASDYKHQIEYYQTLIDDFSSDSVNAAVKSELKSRADKILENLKVLMAENVDLANVTMSDFYSSKTASSLNYLMAVTVSSNISVPVFVVLAFIIGMFFSCIYVYFRHTLVTQLELRKLNQILKTKESIEKIDAASIENMTPMELAFFDQAKRGFPELYLVYQPIVDEYKNWVAGESLVRWKNSRIGQISPAEFIPIAEKYNLMDMLDEWILYKACMQSNEWTAKGIKNHRISVNITASQIESDSFMDIIMRILNKLGGESKFNIMLEISGGGEFNEIGTIKQKCVALNAFGIQIAIDRFGDTMSSMRAIYDLPLDMIKIPCSGILDESNKGKTRLTGMLNNLLEVGEARNIKICAEGIEDDSTYTLLRGLGVKYMQGYLFAHPLPADEYKEKLDRRNF